MNLEFTKTEVRDLIISSLLLAFIFTLTNLTIETYIISFLIIVPIFVLHELAHKFVAQKKGYEAHYVLWPTGAMMSLVFSLLTFGRFVFAALGAVVISNKHSSRIGFRNMFLAREDAGLISIAGPLTNFSMAIIGFALSPINTLFSSFAQLNVIVGLFNMFPFPPLDGEKIFAWSWKVWLLASVLGVILLFLPHFISILWTLLIAIALVITTFVVISLIAPPKRKVRDIELFYQ